MKIDPDNIQIDPDEIQGESPYWYNNLRGMLGMLDQIIRFYGNDEEVLKEKAGNFIWKLTQFNLPFTTHEKGKPEVCGTFVKDSGEPGISHLVAQAYPRPQFMSLGSDDYEI
ncbi:MAG: hypothetical protein CMB31_00605 [Euryarchaeota archaeon]|nr:hypothetical protein [Euryarchaeota archaeon]|tara:strand:+ start:4511 stop:4846 length:336 start_codon:yes stop_codon:yes gene_type:complete